MQETLDVATGFGAPEPGLRSSELSPNGRRCVNSPIRDGSEPFDSEPPSAADLERSRESAWAVGIRAGDESSLEALFRAYYQPLRAFAEGYVKSPEVAEDITADVFLRVWERRSEWELRRSLRSYLYIAVRNQALTYLEHRRVVLRAHADVQSSQHWPGMGQHSVPADREVQARELTEAIERAIDRLPERAREAFVLHRKHGLNYAEVAETMGIAPRTVEVHIRRAFKVLRDQLSGFIVLILYFLP